MCPAASLLSPATSYDLTQPCDHCRAVVSWCRDPALLLCLIAPETHLNACFPTLRRDICFSHFVLSLLRGGSCDAAGGTTCFAASSTVVVRRQKPVIAELVTLADLRIGESVVVSKSFVHPYLPTSSTLSKYAAGHGGSGFRTVPQRCGLQARVAVQHVSFSGITGNL